MLKQDPITKLYYYDEKPDNVRLATVNDFFKPKLNMPYLIHGYHWQVYQCCRVRKEFKISSIQEWLHDNRIYVFVG